MARATSLSGMRMPTVRRPLKALGSLDNAGRMKVNGPGRLDFISLNCVLSNLAYCATCEMSSQMMDRLVLADFISLMEQMRSMAWLLSASQPNAYTVSVG